MIAKEKKVITCVICEAGFVRRDEADVTCRDGCTRRLAKIVERLKDAGVQSAERLENELSRWTIN